MLLFDVKRSDWLWYVVRVDVPREEKSMLRAEKFKVPLAGARGLLVYVWENSNLIFTCLPFTAALNMQSFRLLSFMIERKFTPDMCMSVMWWNEEIYISFVHSSLPNFTFPPPARKYSHSGCCVELLWWIRWTWQKRLHVSRENRARWATYIVKTS